MERLKKLNRLLLKGDQISPEKRFEIVKERRELLNKAFSYSSANLDILRDTNARLIRVAEKIYAKAHELNAFRAQLNKENRADGFAPIKISGEAGVRCVYKSLHTNDLLPEEELNASFYLWNDSCFQRFPSLESFVYRPFPLDTVASCHIQIDKLKEIDKLCYGMYELLFLSEFSIQDIADKVLFGWEVRFTTDKIVLMEDLSKSSF